LADFAAYWYRMWVQNYWQSQKLKFQAAKAVVDYYQRGHRQKDCSRQVDLGLSQKLMVYWHYYLLSKSDSSRRNMGNAPKALNAGVPVEGVVPNKPVPWAGWFWGLVPKAEVVPVDPNPPVPPRI
jgi:hypothetical protein